MSSIIICITCDTLHSSGARCHYNHLEDEVLAGRHGQHRRSLPLECEVGKLIVWGGGQGVRLDQELHLATPSAPGEHILPGHSHWHQMMKWWDDDIRWWIEDDDIRWWIEDDDMTLLHPCYLLTPPASPCPGARWRGCCWASSSKESRARPGPRPLWRCRYASWCCLRAHHGETGIFVWIIT